MAKEYTYKVKREDTKIEVEVQASPKLYQAQVEIAFNRLKDTVKVSGFRPGKAPKQAIMAKLGTDLIDEAFNHLLPEIAEVIVEEEKFRPITNLDYKLIDFSEKDGVKFTFTFVPFPEIKLPDWKKIKVTKAEASVADKDIDEVVVRLFKDDFIKSQAKPEDDKAKSGKANKKEQEVKDADVIAYITDEKIAELAFPEVKTMEQLRKYIQEQLLEIKSREAEDAYVTEVVGAAIKQTNIPVSAELIEMEVHEREHEYEDRIKQLGLELDTFLAAQQTSMEDLKTKWKEEVEMRFKEDVLLSEVAKAYDKVPSMEDVDDEIAKLTDPKMQAEYNTPNGRTRVYTILVRQQGLRKLLELVGTPSK